MALVMTLSFNGETMNTHVEITCQYPSMSSMHHCKGRQHVLRKLGCWAIRCERFLIYSGDLWKTSVGPGQSPPGLVGPKAWIPCAS